MIRPQRLLEIFPGALTWTTLIFPIVFSFYAPNAVAIFIILYTTLWFCRSLEFSFHLIKSYVISRKYLKKDWIKLCEYFQEHNNLEADIKKTQDKRKKRFLQKIRKSIEFLKSIHQFKHFKDIRHIVIIATYKEEVEVLRSSIQSLAENEFDLKNVTLVLATEERDKEQAQKNADILQNEFKGILGSFYHFMHPKDIPGEVKGKGANITYAGKKVAKILEDQNEDFSNYVLTTLDADNKVHKYYLSNLTFHYLSTPDRKKKSYQPLPLFYNNIWDVPILNRMVAISSSFWHLFESGRPDRLRNFSSHAQSLDALKEMDFWSVKTIVEDGHQYWRAFFCFNGDHNVIPLFIPVYQDAVLNRNYYRSIIAQYQQLRRWAWGASDIPYVIQNMWRKRKDLPCLNSMLQLLRLIEGHYMWATAPIIITIATPVPRMINAQFGETVMAYNLAFVLANIFSYALIGIIVSSRGLTIL